MKKISFYSFSVVLIFSLTLLSCKKDLTDPGGTAAEKMAGEWFVTLDLGNQRDVYHIGYFQIATYNTAANDNTMWVDDLKHGWGFKSKVNADYGALTFSAPAGADNAYYVPSSPSSFPLKVKITDGKVLKGVGKSKAGNVVDSIYMKVEFSDDPGTIYEMKGHQRSGFFEDEF